MALQPDLDALMSPPKRTGYRTFEGGQIGVAFTAIDADVCAVRKSLQNTHFMFACTLLGSMHALRVYDFILAVIKQHFGAEQQQSACIHSRHGVSQRARTWGPRGPVVRSSQPAGHCLYLTLGPRLP